jgi:hypothetical protein
MLTMAFLANFPNPVRQPHMVRADTPNELFNCLKRGRGDALVLRDSVWAGMSDEEKAGMKLIASPEKSYPERTFTAGGKVDDALRQKIAEALLSDEGAKVSKALLDRLNKEKLVAAKGSDYKGLDELLNPMWGFHRR